MTLCLAEARNAIAAAKLPLVKTSSEIAERIGNLETKINRLELEQSQFEVNRKRLQQGEETLPKTLSLIARLGQDSGKILDEALLPGGVHYIAMYIKSFKFYPALLKGKPVESQQRVRFADF